LSRILGPAADPEAEHEAVDITSGSRLCVNQCGVVLQRNDVLQREAGIFLDELKIGLSSFAKNLSTTEQAKTTGENALWLNLQVYLRNTGRID